MKPEVPQSELPSATPEQVMRASELAEEVLGDGFSVEYGALPRNVGNRGDHRAVGDTALIATESDTPAKDFAERYEQVGELATKICNETPTVRVVIDVTPKDAVPTFLPEKTSEDLRPFIERVTSRIEGYVELKRKYYDLLEDEAIQQEVWGQMNQIDADFKRSLVERGL